MNVYQRPLFRQMGGPVAPGMAMQEAMPPAMGAPGMGAPGMGGQDPMMAVQQAEMMAAQQTAGLGEQYAQDTLANIDAAETPEQIINALRGNEVPLEQRYAELAQFVGEADAQRTPESVLALVQPTIMMTEQGAMDSGIGELMQGMTGDIPMETAGGQPTEMGQGIGSLMMAGAPATPEMGVGQQPVANFRQGGVVQRFQTGGEASRLQALYSEMLPVYQGILGDGSDQRRMTQSQILFDIADRAGAFAAGIDPRTGQSVARLSPAAQLAAATSGLGGQIGERLGRQEDQDRALRLSALQAAQGEYSAERAAARAAAAAGANRGVGTLYDVIDSEGNLLRRVPVSTRAELEQLTAEVAEIGGDFRPSQFDAPGLETYVNPNDPADRVRAARGSAEAVSAQARGLLPVSEASTVAAMMPKPKDPVTYVNPENPIDRVRAVPGSPEAVAAEARGMFPLSDASTLVGLTPDPVEAVTYVDPRNPDDRITAVPGSAEAVAAQARGLIRTSEATAVAGLAPKPEGPPDLVSFELPGVDGGPATTVIVDKASAEGRAQIAQIQQIPGARPVSVTGARPTPLFENVQAITDYAYGAANANAVAAMQNALANPPTSVDPTTGQTIMGNIPNFLIEAEARRVIRGDSTQLDPEDPRVLRAIQAIRRAEAQSEENAQALVNGVAQNVIGEIALIGDPPPDIEDPDYVLRLQQSAENAFGTLSAAKSVFNTFLGVFTLNPPAPVAQQAINDVRSLNAATDVAYRRMVEGKVAQEAVNRFVSTLPNPASTLTSPQEAVSQIRSIIGFLQSGRAIAEASLASRTLSQSDAQELRTAIISSEMSIRGYQAIIDGIEGRRWTSSEIEEELRRNDTERQRRIDELRRMGGN